MITSELLIILSLEITLKFFKYFTILYLLENIDMILYEVHKDSNCFSLGERGILTMVSITAECMASIVLHTAW